MAKSDRKTPAVNDPIEGSKMEKRGEPPPDQTPPVTDPELQATLADASARAEEPTSPGVLVPPPPPTKEVVKYRVTKRTTISHFGQQIVLNPDDIVSAESYGHEGVARILDSNVPMVKIEQ